MDTEQKKSIKFFSIVFVIISVISLFYASFSQRGLYCDGSFYLIELLNNIADNKFSFVYDPYHPRMFVLILTEIPTLIAGILFKVSDKITLATIYSFTQFALPLLGLWWNYELTKRTKQHAVLFWSVFSYCCIILLFQIYSIVELIVGVPFLFVLLNYLLGKIRYTFWDKIGIAGLIVLMFGTYEYTIFTGFIVFIAMFSTLFETEDGKDLLIKIVIGAGSLAAAAYTFIFLLLGSKDGEIQRYISEATDFWSAFTYFNFFVTVVTILLLSVLIFKKKKISYALTGVFSFIYLFIFVKMIKKPLLFLSPAIEGHTRTVLCWFIPVVLLGTVIYRFIYKKDLRDYVQKFYIPVLLCGITLTCLQIVHTYYWNVNIDYLKKEIASCEEPLYIPEQHEEISSLNNSNLRRYIRKGSYLTTALIFDKNYKIKTLLVHNICDSSTDDSFYGSLYPVFEEGKISIPYGEKINIVNKFWDLTDVVVPLDEYIKSNNIDVDR